MVYTFKHLCNYYYLPFILLNIYIYFLNIHILIFYVHIDERKLGVDEKPLLVQLNWHKDDREGRFLLRRIDEKTNVNTYFFFLNICIILRYFILLIAYRYQLIIIQVVHKYIFNELLIFFRCLPERSKKRVLVLSESYQNEKRNS